MKIVAISGTPGTGKTLIAKKISNKFNFDYLDANTVIEKYNISEAYDKKRKTKIVDIKKLNKALIEEINNIKTKNGIIIDSHLSHYLPKKYVDLCIITKSDLKVLKNRLKRRKYTNEKIRENMDAEIFDICLNEAREIGHKIIIIETSKKLNFDLILKNIRKSLN